MLPIFSSGRINYTNEVFIFLCQHLIDLPPQQAKQMLYSKFIHTIGIRGRNIPLEEHLNKLCKTVSKVLVQTRQRDQSWDMARL